VNPHAVRTVLRRWLHRRTSRRDEDGTATAFVVGFAIVLLACAGLVIDGGTALNARMRLADDTEQAARAGAREIDLLALRERHVVVLSPVDASARSDSYLNSIGYSDYSSTVVRCADGTPDACVQVRARDVVPTTMLKLAGVPSFTIEATATAQAVSQ
jgi:Flp pilus assembly protein TadG